MKKLLLAMILLMLFTTVAIAGDEALSPTGQAASGLMQLLATTLATLLTGLLSVLVAYLAKKYKFEANQAWIATANEWIDKAIHAAEEWGNQRIKASETINGNEKLNASLAFLNKVGADKRLLEMGEEKLKLMVESRLNQLRGPTKKIEVSSADPKSLKEVP